MTNVADKKKIGTAQRIGEKVLKIAEQTEKSGARIVAAIGGEERGVVSQLKPTKHVYIGCNMRSMK